MSYKKLIQNYIDESYRYPPNLADQCNGCQSILMPDPCDPCWKNPLLPPPQPCGASCAPCPMFIGNPRVNQPYMQPMDDNKSKNKSKRKSKCCKTKCCEPKCCKSKCKIKCKTKCKTKCCKSKCKCKKQKKLKVQDDCETYIRVSTCPPPSLPICCEPCCPPQPCNPCEQPWIRGWPWITRTWNPTY